MPTWLMKPGPGEYVLYSTIIDEQVSTVMTRDEAVEMLIVVREVSRNEAVDTVAWTDKHLCSCRARFGEGHEIRNGKVVTIGGGALAYSFDSYEEVRQFMGVHTQ
jgi:hypothetical protein